MMANRSIRGGQLASHRPRQSGENRGKFEGIRGHTNIPDIIRTVSGPPVVRFDGFALDAARRLVSRGGRRVHLTRKAFDLLSTLIEQAPRVVSKDELHRRLWPDTFVTDATIAGASPKRESRRTVAGSRTPRTAQGDSRSRYAGSPQVKKVIRSPSMAEGTRGGERTGASSITFPQTVA